MTGGSAHIDIHTSGTAAPLYAPRDLGGHSSAVPIMAIPVHAVVEMGGRRQALRSGALRQHSTSNKRTQQRSGNRVCGAARRGAARHHGGQPGMAEDEKAFSEEC